MMTQAKVKERYANCLAQVVMWLSRNGYSVYPKDVAIVLGKQGADSVVVSTSTPIHLFDWPQRAGSSKRVHILASFSETISLTKGTCTQAKTKVSYFRVANNTATALETMHFDCCVPPVDLHPVCHVQNGCDYIQGPEPFPKTIDDAAMRSRCQSIKVPTAFVNMPGLFAILAADHMSREHWGEFTRTCLTHFNGIPQLESHPQIDQVLRDARLKAWSWYKN